MFTKLKTALLAVAAISLLAACERIKDDLPPCGVWLEFVFDYNMEFDDTFGEQVANVDVMVFDMAGNCVQTRVATMDELEGRKRMWLHGLPQGTYNVLAAGNFTEEHFQIAYPTLEEAMIALNTTSTAQEIPHLFLGAPVEVEYNARGEVRTMSLLRATNRFDIALRGTIADPPAGTVAGPVVPLHTVEIEASEAGVYDRHNNPLLRELTAYRPHSLLSDISLGGDDTFRDTDAKINTMRLLEDEDYRIVVRDIESGEELFSRDLLPLLAETKPATRPDGSELPLAEYLDRRGEWTIRVDYGEGEPTPTLGNAFVALRIVVNGWIVWQNDIHL